MSMRSTPPTVIKAEPRGRPGIAIFGLILVVVGIALVGFLSGGGSGLTGIILSSNATNTPTPDQTAPNGEKPANFVAYRDTQSRFALYVSQTWGHQDTTVPVNSQSSPAVSFTPQGSKLPSWTIAFTAAPIDENQFLFTLGDTLAAQGGTDYTPQNVTTVTSGKNQWSQLDATIKFNGQNITLSAFLRPFGNGSVLVLAEALSLTAENDVKQNFTPMLVSLSLKS